MAFDSVSDNLQRLNDNIHAFAKSSGEYYRLNLFHKSMKGATSLVKMLVLGFFLLLSLFFLSLAVSVLLSAAIGAPSSGFFIVGGLYLLLFLFVKISGGKHIEKFLLIKFSRLYFEKFDSDDEELEKKPEDETL